jgi:hypothetical protein
MLMKKALLLALTLAVICVWAAPAMAIDWIAFGGFSVKSAFYKNIDYRIATLQGGVPGSGQTLASPPVGGLYGFGDHQWNKTPWWVQMRGNIYVVARASADLQGVFGIEVNSTRFGEPQSSASQGGDAGKWNADAIAIQVKSMYIDFKVPEVPVRLKVGIQPFRLREPVFLYVDAAGVTGNVKLTAGDYIFNINPFWAVMSKGSWTGLPLAAGAATDQTTADDGNFFGVDINAVFGDIKPGVFFAMQRQGQIYDGVNPITTLAGEGDRDLWWLGAYVDAKFGGLAITGDFVYNGGYDYWKSGTISLNYLEMVTPNYEARAQGYSARHEAWLARGVVSYTMNKFTFGAGGLYGTGDNPGTRDKDEGYRMPWRSEGTKFNDDFLVLMGDWGYREPYGLQTTGGLFKTWTTPGAGVWYVRGFMDYAVTDWLKLKFNAGYIGDTVHNEDAFGHDGNDDKSVGWELDTAVQVNIYKNLYFDNAFGYLIGGKALASQLGGFRAQDPWAFISCLTYVF